MTARLPRISARKHGGDDAYSWAVFIEGQDRPFVSGLARGEVSHYKAQAAKILKADREDQEGPRLCKWYALCTNPAEGTVSHPVLGDVPTCTRCAGKHGLDLQVAGR